MIFPGLKKPFCSDGDEKGSVSFSGAARRGALAAASGVAMSLAFPPCNQSVLAFLALVPLILLVLRRNWLSAAFFGWLWGVGWSLPAFWWLREINPAVPFAIAPVLGLWSAVFASLLPWLFRAIVIPPDVVNSGYTAEGKFCTASTGRLLLFAATASGWWCILDFARVDMFPWNYLAVTQYRLPLLLQIAEYTGGTGVTWAIVFVNFGVALPLFFTPRCLRAGLRPPVRVFLVVLAFLSGLLFCGVGLFRAARGNAPLKTLSVLTIQGDISQRRNADSAGAQEALDIYTDLTAALLPAQKNKPDLVVWPETAVPYPVHGASTVSAQYRVNLYELLRKNRVPMLVGSLDFRKKSDGTYGLTNSALLFGAEAQQLGRYDKIHRVPFGEFIPLRAILPQWFIRLIDMKRDLIPGVDSTPLEVAPGIRAGIAICYESIFASLARSEARRGANMLLIVSNDAWYPTSSEPEQHLANAVLRSIETRLPSLRCGNNGGTLVVRADGTIGDALTGVTGRRRAGGVLKMEPRDGEMTFYVRHGEIFLLFAALLTLGGFTFAVAQWRKSAQLRLARFEEPGKKEEQTP